MLSRICSIEKKGNILPKFSIGKMYGEFGAKFDKSNEDLKGSGNRNFLVNIYEVWRLERIRFDN